MNFTKPALFGYTCTLLACIVKPYCFLTNKIIKHANVANICLCSKTHLPLPLALVFWQFLKMFHHLIDLIYQRCLV